MNQSTGRRLCFTCTVINCDAGRPLAIFLKLIIKLTDSHTEVVTQIERNPKAAKEQLPRNTVRLCLDL